MKLAQLETFVAVAEELHFGRAAERLHRSQPPISRQVRLLEEELGFELFIRNTQNVALTPAGKIFLNAIRPALAQIHGGADAARRAAAGEVGQLSIGMTGSIMFGAIPRVLAEFRRLHPDVTVDLRLAPKSVQLQAVKDESLMLSLVRSPSPDADLAQETLLDEPLVVAMNVANPLTARSHLELAELASQDFILYRGHASVSVADTIIGACHQAGYTPSVVQETEDMQAAAALAALGAGITLVAASLQQLALPGLVYRPVGMNGVPIPIRLYAVYRRAPMPHALDAFLSLARRLCAARPA